MSNLSERSLMEGPLSRPALTERLRPALRWETGLAVVVILILVIGSAASPDFLTGNNLFNLGLSNGEIAIMTLPMTLIIISGEIDLSVASILGMSSALLGYLWSKGWPMPAIFVFVAVVGLAAGAVNGLLVTRLRLPSLAVTIGTLALYRGIATIILGPNTVSNFPTAYTNLGVNAVPFTGNDMTYSTLIFIVLAIIFGVVLHATPLGRSIYAMGASAGGRPVRRDPGEADQDRPVHAVRLHLRPGRRAVDVPAGHRRAEQRPRPRTQRRRDRAARRGVDLRRQGLADRRRARGARLRRHSERPAARPTSTRKPPASSPAPCCSPASSCPTQASCCPTSAAGSAGRRPPKSRRSHQAHQTTKYPRK